MVSGSFSLPCPGFFSPFPHGTGTLSVFQEYLALADGPAGFTQGFTCPALLRIPLSVAPTCPYGTITPYGAAFQPLPVRRAVNLVVLQPRHRRNGAGLGCSDFARRYSRNHSCFLFLRLLRCFSSAGSPTLAGVTGLQPAGLPHSDTHGSMLVCSSPWIFAAYRVLHRLWKPRHPPYALLLLVAPVAAATDALVILYLYSILLRVSSLTSNMRRPMAPTRFRPNMSMNLCPPGPLKKKARKRKKMWRIRESNP